MPRVSALAVTLFVATLAASGRAQPASPKGEPKEDPKEERSDDAKKAEELFDKGLADMRAGRYDTGCPALAESYKLDPLPGAVFTLGECESRWGKIASAVTHYREYLELYGKLPADEKAEQKKRAEVAEQQTRDLEPVIPTLTVKLKKGTPANAKVTHNGKPVDSPGTPIPVDPGEHRITIEVPGKPAHTETVVVTRAEKREVLIGLPVARIDKPADDDDGDGHKPVKPKATLNREAVRISAIIASAVGAAGGVTSVIAGAITLSRKSTIEDNCTGSACNTDGKDAADAAQVSGMVSTVGFVVGGAGLVTAVALWIVYAATDDDPARTEQAHVGFEPGGVTISW